MVDLIELQKAVRQIALLTNRKIGDFLEVWISAAFQK
jgi:hypothetical protein